eukprot:12682426-Ditylum_brightwellii.AAC.1
MREVLPLIRLLNKVRGSMRISQDAKVESKCKVFEDNNECIELPKCPRIRPRTKLIGIKYHHFRSRVEDGTVSVERTDTKDQQADIFIKNLARDQSLKLRMLICGW